MDMLRRTILKGASASGMLTVALAAGVLKPEQVLAATWNKSAFESKDLDAALKSLGASAATESKDIVLKAPDIAENGAVVPVEVTSNIPNTSELSILVVMNPFPLSTTFNFSNGAVAEASVRLKLAQTSVVKVIAKADGKFYTAQKEVKVTVGGCGG
ncbi:MAG: thiosulfate oxidation carrier protein SoxY [Rhodocyclaceae bacterium]|nr:MAG: thiosulfate oxidation carrier protein SoxY [Rhodocyclaceae bacterium]